MRAFGPARMFQIDTRLQVDILSIIGGLGHTVRRVQSLLFPVSLLVMICTTTGSGRSSGSMSSKGGPRRHWFDFSRSTWTSQADGSLLLALTS